MARPGLLASLACSWVGTGLAGWVTISEAGRLEGIGEKLVGLAGLEPAARGLGNLCSIRLSYRPLTAGANSLYCSPILGNRRPVGKTEFGGGLKSRFLGTWTRDREYHGPSRPVRAREGTRIGLGYLGTPWPWRMGASPREKAY